MEELQELEQTKKLTPKQEKFIDEYLECCVAGRAYAKVYGLDYNDPKDNANARKAASRLLSNVDIQARVKQLKEEQRKKSAVSREYLIAKSIDVLEGALKGVPEMKMNREGKFVPTGNYIRDNKGANDAIKNIANMLGFNEQQIKAEVEAKTEVNVVTAKDVIDELIGS